MATTETVTEHTAHDQVGGGDWSGGKEPFHASYGKLMMWYFLLSDAFTVAGKDVAGGLPAPWAAQADVDPASD